MTIEEVIRLATRLRTDFKCESDTMVDFCDTIIKALEQEPILDKIRAEIEQITDTMGVRYNQYVSKIDVLQIIDKYKAKSEG